MSSMESSEAERPTGAAEALPRRRRAGRRSRAVAGGRGHPRASPVDLVQAAQASPEAPRDRGDDRGRIRRPRGRFRRHRAAVGLGGARGAPAAAPAGGGVGPAPPARHALDGGRRPPAGAATAPGVPGGGPRGARPGRGGDARAGARPSPRCARAVHDGAGAPLRGRHSGRGARDARVGRDQARVPSGLEPARHRDARALPPGAVRPSLGQPPPRGAQRRREGGGGAVRERVAGGAGGAGGPAMGHPVDARGRRHVHAGACHRPLGGARRRPGSPARVAARLRLVPRRGVPLLGVHDFQRPRAGRSPADEGAS